MTAYYSNQFIAFGVHIIWDVKPIVIFDYSRSYNTFNAIRVNDFINVTIGESDFLPINKLIKGMNFYQPIIIFSIIELL